MNYKREKSKVRKEYITSIDLPKEIFAKTKSHYFFVIHVEAKIF